jgi:hypothetical protein
MLNMHTQHDLKIRIDATLGEKLLNSLDFPLRLDFSTEDENDLPLDPIDEPPEESLEALVEDVVAQPLVTHLEHESTTAASLSIATTPNTVTANTTEKAGSGEKRFEVRLRSCSVMVTCPPELHLGNPVTLTNVQLRVQVDLQVGARIWGKWHWRDTTTPWLNLEGRRAVIRLSAQGSQLLAAPELESSHMVLSLTIWKWPLRCRVNISQLINRQLNRLGPLKIVDFADLNLDTRFFGKTARFSIAPLMESEGELIVKANVEWI